MFSREIIIKNKKIEEKVNFSDYTIPLSDRFLGALACAVDAGLWMLRIYLNLCFFGLVIIVSFLVALLKEAGRRGDDGNSM